MRPLVSIIVPTYNGATRGFLTNAIESVLNQSFQDYELFVVDDGSTDDTKEQCEQYLTMPQVHYIFQENGGPARARNAGIKASQGEFICFLDDDDLWKPQKLARQIQFIQRELHKVPNWGMIFSWIELIDEQGVTLGYRGHRHEGSIYRHLFMENTIDATSSVLIRRGVFDKVGLFDESLLNRMDWDMWLRIAKEYLVFPVREYLVQHREHLNRISAEHERVFFYERAVLEKALASAPEDINAVEVYASWYLNKSEVLFASEQYSEFRKILLSAVRLSPRPLRLRHLCLLIMSFTGVKSIRFLRKLKRYTTTVMVNRKRDRPKLMWARW